VEHAGLELQEGLGQLAGLGRRLLQEVEGQPLGGLGPDAGQALERVEEPADRERDVPQRQLLGVT
jgi:hypothetical protein